MNNWVERTCVREGTNSRHSDQYGSKQHAPTRCGGKASDHWKFALDISKVHRPRRHHHGRDRRTRAATELLLLCGHIVACEAKALAVGSDGELTLRIEARSEICTTRVKHTRRIEISKPHLGLLRLREVEVKSTRRRHGSHRRRRRCGRDRKCRYHRGLPERGNAR